jgi:delta 1-pyrroline-5-carboxylate dehydrogenase
MPCVYLFNVGKISELRKHYEELKPYKNGFLFKWGRTNNLKRRTGEHIKNYGNLISSTLQLKYFSPVDNMYEVDAENEIRQYFHSNAISFKNHKELIILDRREIADARKFYEEVYEKFSSEVDKLLGRNKELEHNAEYTKEIIKCKNENIKKLNEECAWLRSEMISFQEREKEYKEELSEMMEQLALSQKLHEETQKSHQETIKQLTSSEAKYKKCQDVLCEIALLTPDERNKLHNLVKTTRINLDPFLA